METNKSKTIKITPDSNSKERYSPTQPMESEVLSDSSSHLVFDYESVPSPSTSVSSSSSSLPVETKEVKPIKNTSTASPWKSFDTPQQNAVSFSELMSEDLAKNLQQK